LLPVLFNLSWFTLYSYPLFLGFAFGIGLRVAISLVEKYGVEPKLKADFIISIFLGTWIGAKLLFLVVNTDENSFQYVRYSSFWLGGGFVFYGGFIFALAILAVYVFILKRFNLQDVALLVPALAFGHGVGRLGCLLAGCCYGSETSSFFSIYLHHASRHPVQLYESLLLFILGFVTYKMVKASVSRSKIIITYLYGYSLVRFALEFLRGDEIRGVFFNLFSTSQIVSIVIIFLSTCFIFIVQRRSR
jgi:phosphatidylglycerol:prolipoprotein diacylglycerol transferase